MSIKALAGPRVVEHLVDVVLMFEGDRQHLLRMLRSVKNRFGSTNELGLFAMEGEGLVGIEDPSRALLAERPEHAAGSAVVAAIEGSRPLLVEVQALLVPAYGPPRRVASGIDPHRVALMLAVMERHLKIRVSQMDGYFKLTGGVSLEDPALDLGILLAAVSSWSNHPIPSQWVVMGEVGLAGELRRVHRMNERLNEAAHLGFTQALVPPISERMNHMALTACDNVQAAVAALHIGKKPSVSPESEGGNA
ncbi:MAG: DNA repair protein RadA [Firmicutes bacterium]|nr:DNA repair protein RadA [Bacillota bacterium]